MPMWLNCFSKPTLNELVGLARAATAKFMVRARSRYSKTISLWVVPEERSRRPRRCHLRIMHCGRVSADAA